MSLVRPEIAAALSRGREVITGMAVALFGLWLATRGGAVFLMLGAAVGLAALGLTLIAWRRMRFRLEIDAPGVVEIDEGRISYLGPIMGGSVNLSELTEIEVLLVAGRRRCWRISQSDGQALLVPLAAAGADRLYDLFAALPGADARMLLSALQGNDARARTIWRRPLAARQLPEL
ncbi:hypothetical protein [Tropicimonas sp. IMCC34043]|uniref:hypothetical protein n=1 Tax=Tropicimonas sp. IMCC34043 TaxID=2248760 RepID=UPI000E24EADF|nr:hypothetical protein [Tropicimonas sp. IMCC34043]